MSNLSFKSKAHPVHLRNFIGNYAIRELAYSTYVTSYILGEYSIRHHDSEIATIGDYNVFITNAGYDSSTTRNRLNMILRDNHIPFAIYQRNFKQILVNTETRETVTENFYSARFAMVAGEWVIID